MNNNKTYDVIIIGSGPGGYVAAIRSAQLGLTTALVERDKLGGICLNWGCIPTKALLRAADIRDTLHDADNFGLSYSDTNFDIQKIVKRSREVAAHLSKGVEYLLNKNKVHIIKGEGRFAKNNKIKITNTDNQTTTIYSYKNAIIATGAQAKSLPNIVQPSSNSIWTYKEAMIPKSLPKSLLVIGGGAIGVEFASFYLRFGVPVTLIEGMSRILPSEDEEISQLATKQFNDQGMVIKTNSTLKSLKTARNNSVTAVIQNSNGSEEEFTFDRAILAVGIVGNTESLGLNNTKVKTTKGHIQTDQWMKTHEPGIYAIGDVTGPPWLAHKASHEGITCIEGIANFDGAQPLKIDNIPSCTYSSPQIASIGLTEDAAQKKGYKIKIGRFPFSGNGKAIALGEPQGMIKTIFDEKTGELLGAHMIGSEVTELIQGYTIAKTMECTEADLIHTIFPHPTLSEMMHESVLEAYNRSIHI